VWRVGRSVVAWGYGWTDKKLSIKCTYSFGGEIWSRCGFQCQELQWYVLGEFQVAAWCEIPGMNDTTVLRVAAMVLSAGLEQRVMVCGCETGVRVGG